MASFMKCPHCNKVQRDIMGETVYKNGADVLIKCTHCGYTDKESNWKLVTRKDWGILNRLHVWFTVQLDRLCEFLKI